MANLEGMPIGSLPEATEIQDEDEVVVYRPSTGKAYQANTDLIDSLETIFSTGTALSTGDDLNDYMTPGKYYTSNATISESLVNSPSGSDSITMFVIQLQNAARRCQIIINSSNSVKIYVRIYISSWASWKIIDVTSV